jgi:3-oxoacyl-[acyl-carrier-protein] synthase II
MENRRVVISGIGVLTPYGIGSPVYWENISKGKTAAAKITHFDVSQLPTKFAASIKLLDAQLDPLIKNQKTLKTLSRSGKFAVIAADEAVEDAQLNTTKLDPFRFGTSLGAGGLGLGDLDYALHSLKIAYESFQEGENQPNFSLVWQNMLESTHPLTPLKALSNVPTAHIAINYNARGNCQTITTACTSSAQAIGEAYRQIKFGIADVMITGGSDSMINPNGLIAFSTLGVLTKNNAEFKSACCPFDKQRDGFMLGEGAAILILEEIEHCLKRGGRPYGEIIGYASTCDAYRLTDEPPEAWGSIAAMKNALQDADISPGDIDYINAHGTSTRLNDKTETFAIKQVCGETAYSIPVSSTKSMIGHFVAGAGAVEFTACVLAMKHKVIPPTINFREPDPECDLDYVPNYAREAPLNIILSNSFGFGGQNACLVLKKLSQ